MSRKPKLSGDFSQRHTRLACGFHVNGPITQGPALSALDIEYPFKY